MIHYLKNINQTSTNSFGFLLILFLTCNSCVIEMEDGNKNLYKLEKPDHFPEILYSGDPIEITQKGFELGKKLFNEPRLSIDNSVACSNCHVQSVSFTDPQHNPSIGVHNRVGTRNAPPIVNMAFQQEFFWDGGVTHLDFTPINAIENEKEMDESLSNVVQKLNNFEEYRTAFEKAFPGSDSITAPLLLKAFSQYMLLLISDNSKFDKVVLGKMNFTNQEATGKRLFDKHCAQCHTPPLFTNGKYMNNGLDSVFNDIGRAAISEDKNDIGKFKVPTLRNIEKTSPYMHDGRFNTLDEVLHHYNSKVISSKTLAQELIKPNGLGIPLTSKDKENIKIYLKTLTDMSFLTNPVF